MELSDIYKEWQEKAFKYDCLIKKIEEKINNLKEDGYWDFYNTDDIEKTIKILEELYKEGKYEKDNCI